MFFYTTFELFFFSKLNTITRNLIHKIGLTNSNYATTNRIFIRWRKKKKLTDYNSPVRSFNSLYFVGLFQRRPTMNVWISFRLLIKLNEKSINIQNLSHFRYKKYFFFSIEKNSFHIEFYCMYFSIKYSNQIDIAAKKKYLTQKFTCRINAK